MRSCYSFYFYVRHNVRERGSHAELMYTNICYFMLLIETHSEKFLKTLSSLITSTPLLICAHNIGIFT